MSTNAKELMLQHFARLSGQLQFVEVPELGPDVRVYFRPVESLHDMTSTLRLDSDNNVAAFKHVRDGVTDALGLKDDDDPRLTWAYDQEKGATCIRIVVTGYSEPNGTRSKQG